VNPPRQPAPHGPIDLHIEELVLHGFAPADRHRIAQAVEAELTRLAAAQGLPGLQHSSGEDARPLQLRGGAFQVKAGAKPQAIGAEIAKAVFGGLRQHARLSAMAARRSQLSRGGGQR
jgi:hypothetical protein